MAQPKTFVKSTPFLRSHRRRNSLLVVFLVLGVAGGSVAAQSFAASHTMQMHWHPQLSVAINGSPMTVPAQIGIDASLWKDHSLDQFGIGMSPLHTHDATGTIHEESNTVRDFTLQEFLAIWGQHLDSEQVLGHPVDPGHRAYIVVDGSAKPAGVLDMVFADKMTIQIVCGQ